MGDAAADERRFDSLVARQDTILSRRQAERDSLALVLRASSTAGLRATATPVRADSELRERPPQPPPRTALPPVATAGTSPATGAVPPVPAAKSRPLVVPNSMTERGIARGDSIARADARRMMEKSAPGSNADSVWGRIEVQGKPPMTRAVLRTSARTLISLSGIATDGLTELGGADVVVRGLKVSPRDVVVKEFIVRSVAGTSAVDGRLMQAGKEFAIMQTDGRGLRQLTAVPQVLQAAVGARIWVTFAPGTTTPRNYGVITRR